MPRHMSTRLLPVLAFAFLLSACTTVPDLLIFPGVHKLDLQQGNIIDQEKLDQLAVGMSRAQVQFVMGTPLVADTFDLDRWDYVYEFRSAEGQLTRRTVTLNFLDGALTQIRSSYGSSEEPSEETSSL